jgi:hypothetical protein
MENTGIKKQVGLNDVLMKNKNVDLRDETIGKYLLFNLDSLECLVINDSGKRIWDLFENPKTVADVITKIVDSYDLSSLKQNDSKSIIENFITILYCKDLLQRVNF